MMDSVLLRLPDLQDSLNQMMVIVYKANINGEISEGDKLKLISLSSEISTGILPLRSNARVSWDNDNTGRMQQLTAFPLDDIEDRINDFLTAVNTQILSPDQLNLTPELFDSAEAAQAATTAYYGAVSQALEYGINGRIQNFTDRLTFAILFALLVTSVALFVGFLLMRSISRPLGKLAVAAKRLGSGERDVHVPVTGEDEVGQVGFAFNTMVSELEAAQKNQKAQLNQLTQLTKALETSASVSSRLSTILDPSQLMEAVVTEVQHAFNYYHVHIYLYDKAKENLVMAGGTGQAGQTLFTHKHSIPKGKGLVGKAAVTNAHVLVDDVSQIDTWIANPLLPDTKSELAVPIAIGERVLGVLDVQQDEVGTLGSEDVVLLQSVSSTVAIALQNARLYEQAQKRADHESIVNQINQQILGAPDMERVLQIVARELGQALKAKNTTVQLSVRQNSLENGRYSGEKI